MNIVSDQDVAELYQPEKGNIPYDFGHDKTLNLCDTYTQDDSDYDFLEWNDPDKNFYSDMSISPSEYYTIGKARGVLVQNSDNLSLLSLNVRSLQIKLSKC